MNKRPTLQLLMRTLALFAFLLAIWPAPHASIDQAAVNADIRK